MSLPILTCPTSKCTLPVSKTVVEYRPFVVKEQKIMLLAAAAKGPEAPKEILASISQVLTLCTFDKVKVEKLSAIDFEYLFIKIKSASAGSIVEQNYICNREVTVKDDEGVETKQKCGGTTSIGIKHDDIKLNKELPSPKIIINDKLIVVLNPPTVDLVNTMTTSGNTTDELRVMAQCVDIIAMGEEIYSDFTTDEMVDFLGQFTESQIAPVIEYFKSLPALVYHSEFKCKKCGFKHKIDIRGIENFFG